MIKVEYFKRDKKGNKKLIGKTYYSWLKKQKYGLEGIIYNGMARLGISGHAESFRMYDKKELFFCGSI
jgi:hypothetical protein